MTNAGKGSRDRTEDHEAFERGHDRTFGKDTPEVGCGPHPALSYDPVKLRQERLQADVETFVKIGRRENGRRRA